MAIGWTVTAVSARTSDDFAAALSRFAAALSGSFGDEGPQVRSAIESLSLTLAAWDEELRALEARTRSDLRSTPPASAAQLHVDLGRQYVARGRLDDALRELDLALRLDTSRADVHVLRGLIHETADRGADAAAEYRAAWAADRTPVHAYWLLRDPGIARTDEGRQALETLASTYRAPAEKPPRGAPPFSALRSGIHSDANEPLVLPALYADGYSLLVRGDYQGALVRFRDAASSDPLLADPALQSRELTEGSAALRRGRPSVARDLFQALLARSPESSEVHRLLGMACWADFDDVKSIEHFRRAVSLRPRDERSRVTLAWVLVQTGAYSDAEDVLRETLEVLPASASARLRLGSIYVTVDRPVDAAKVYEAAIPSAVKGRSLLYSIVGRMRERARDFEGAIDAFSRAVQTTPNDTKAHVALARLHLLQDRPDEALAEYGATLLIDRDDPDAYMGIGQLHLGAGRYDDAASVLQRLVGQRPTYVEARYALASALLRSGRVDEGNRQLAEYQRYEAAYAVQLRRRMALDAVKREATVQTSEGHHERAVELWQQAVTQEPDQWSNHAALASALAAAQRPAEAVRYYERAAALGGGPHVYKQLTILYAALGRTAESARARSQYEQVLLMPSAEGARR